VRVRQVCQLQGRGEESGESVESVAVCSGVTSGA